MVVADLHVHTTNSDGTLTLETLPDAAREAGVSAVAITDHDRLHPDLDAPVADVEGVTVVHGIELRVETDFGRVDLLGYGVRRTDDLTALVEDLQQNRIERARRIVESVENETGVSIDVALEPGVGRPHIARAIEASDAPYDYSEAFEELIGADRSCYVARDIPSFEAGRDCLTEACGVVGLAHPFRYDDSQQALSLTATLDAVERYYPYGHDVDVTPLLEAVERHDLLVTGGSDAHDRTLGRAGLDRAAFETIRSRIGQ